MAIDYSAIGHRIQTRRKAIGLTQELLAERVNITVVYLSKVENGRVHPTLELLDRLAAELQMELAAVLTGVQLESTAYGNEHVLRLYSSFSPAVKQVAMGILEQLRAL